MDFGMSRIAFSSPLLQFQSVELGYSIANSFASQRCNGCVRMHGKKRPLKSSSVIMRQTKLIGSLSWLISV